MSIKFGLVFVMSLIFVYPPAVQCEVPNSTAQRRSEPGLKFSASISQSFGNTSYTMDALTLDPRDPRQVVPIRSELVFPVDMTLMGFNAQWHPGDRAVNRWAFGAGVRINIDDPSANMTDSDFFQEKQIFYGESVPSADLMLLTADVRYRINDNVKRTFTLLLHLEYEIIEQYVVGFEGWQGSLFSDIRVPVIETRPALDYEVNYLSAQIGAVADFDLGPRIDFAVEGAGGILMAWDRDDHLLRGRLSEGDAVGVALYTKGNLELRPDLFGWSWLFLDLWGELRYFYAEGGVDQTYYAGSSTDPRYTDLPYTLESFQPQVGFSLTVAF